MNYLKNEIEKEMEILENNYKTISIEAICSSLKFLMKIANTEDDIDMDIADKILEFGQKFIQQINVETSNLILDDLLEKNWAGTQRDELIGIILKTSSAINWNDANLLKYGIRKKDKNIVVHCLDNKVIISNDEIISNLIGTMNTHGDELAGYDIVDIFYNYGFTFNSDNLEKLLEFNINPIQYGYRNDKLQKLDILILLLELKTGACSKRQLEHIKALILRLSKDMDVNELLEQVKEDFSLELELKSIIKLET